MHFWYTVHYKPRTWQPAQCNLCEFFAQQITRYLRTALRTLLGQSCIAVFGHWLQGHTISQLRKTIKPSAPCPPTLRNAHVAAFWRSVCKTRGSNLRACQCCDLSENGTAKRHAMATFDWRQKWLKHVFLSRYYPAELRVHVLRCANWATGAAGTCFSSKCHWKHKSKQGQNSFL